MATLLLLIRIIIGLLLIISMPNSPSVASAEELSLDVSRNATLRLLPGLIMEKSPGSKMFCERVKIRSLSRLKHLKKFANSIKVKVSYMNSPRRPPNIQVCFHRNMTFGMGMCPEGQWEKLSKGLWIRSMSPSDNKLLDIQLAGPSVEPLESSLDPLLAAEARMCGILISFVLRRFDRLQLLPCLFRRLCKYIKSNCRKIQDAYGSPVQKSRIREPSSGALHTSIYGGSTHSETFYSTFHTTPEGRKFSKDEWDKFTRESTKKGDGKPGFVSRVQQMGCCSRR